ncbi:MAG: hypothetical protein LIO58_01630 [Oscillospiraceae bacterium]|nr:hypothetical protein [Oscillospiraceae bacterium]
MSNASKKRKILLGVLIAVLVLALGGWLLYRLQLSWVSMEDNLPYDITWNEADSTVHMDVSGLFDMVFDTQEPVAYIGDERIPMQDGVQIRNSRPYFNIRDTSVFNEGLNNAINAIEEADTSDPVAVIANGLYGQGTEEQNATVDALLGGENPQESFELYFQWYNSVHELGHSITTSYGTYDSENMNLRHMVEEEQLVNSFAVAFWMYYGEEEKLDELEVIVERALSNITPPVEDMSHLDFMRKAIDEGKFNEVFTLETYGWFQYNIVRDALRQRDSLDLESILAQMTGNGNVKLQAQETLVYPTLGADMVPEILADVTSTMRDLGVAVPDIYVTFSTDPNDQALRGSFPVTLLEPYIEEGRLIPAFR